MKTILVVLLIFSITGYIKANNQSDSTGNKGDNLDLFAVMDLFKNSKNLEEFEKSLNTENNGINNLDLNGDREVDYIKVVEYADSNSHAVVLQVAVNATENQDVATIELDQVGDKEVNAQIVGDDDVYDNYIVEPTDESNQKTQVVVNVWSWPCVTHIYTPGYLIWHSPWYWHHYPIWWKPWHPVRWHVYHHRHIHYYTHYHRIYYHRTIVAHRVYHRNRVYSPTVRKNYPVYRNKNNKIKNYNSTRNPKVSNPPKKNNQVRKYQNKRSNPQGTRSNGGNHGNNRKK